MASSSYTTTSSSGASIRRRSSTKVQQTTSTLKYDQLPDLDLSDTSSYEEDSDHDNDSLGDRNNNQDESNINNTCLWQQYIHVLTTYPMFRFYLLSHICMNAGDWFVRIASLLVVQEFSSTGAALAHLALSERIPRMIFCPIGGILADRFDRRKLMISLDLVAGFSVLLYVVAIQYKSIELLYVCTAVRASIGAIYYPITTGIVPMLVPNARDMQFATTLNSYAWGSMAVLGGLVAGVATALIGVKACYVLDSVTFFLSAALVFVGIHGDFFAAPKNEHGSSGQDGVTGTQRLFKAVKDLFVYLATCGFGLLVLMKGSAGFVWGPEDIIGVEFATVRDAAGVENEEMTAIRTGLLISVTGLGTLVGPTISNYFSNANRPVTLQRACWIGLVILMTGWWIISLVPNYKWFVIFTFFRTCGSGMLWMNSTLLLQTLTDNDILGRVLALELLSYGSLESVSSVATGKLFDAGLDKNHLAAFAGTLGAVMVTAWGFYHFLSMGAAQPRFNMQLKEHMSDISSLEIELASTQDVSKMLDEIDSTLQSMEMRKNDAIILSV